MTFATSSSSLSEIATTDIAIVGLSAKVPGANTLAEFWQNLAHGKESIKTFSTEELEQAGVPYPVLKNPKYVPAMAVIEGTEEFDAAFFGFSPKEAQLIDPQHRLFLEQSWTTLEQAGYNPNVYGGAIGVYAGVGMNTYLLNSLYPHLLNGADLDTYQVQIRNDKDFLSTLISYKLNLRGPSMAVQTACSTSLVAVHMACQSLINGECDMALAGGVTVDSNPAGYLYQEGMIMSPDGHCRAFDANAQGTVGGNGVGVVLLKRLAEAIADGDTIHAVIKGSAINNDGAAKVGYTAPSVEGQAAAIVEAQAMAQISAETISYIEAHGTGTPLGDPIEITALTKAFRQNSSTSALPTQSCAIGSVKTNIGHLDTAAGVVGLIKVVLSLQHQQIPPSLNFESPNPAIRFEQTPFYVNTQLTPWPATSQPRRAGVSSFGIGGTNAHVVVEEFCAPPVAQQPLHRSSQLLVLSAHTATALQQQRQNLAQWLRTFPDLHLPDVAMTLARGRQPFSHRWVGLASSIPAAIDLLEDDHYSWQDTAADRPAVVFLLPGQGAQVQGMGRDLYAHEQVFRDVFDQCAEILQPLLGVDIRDFWQTSQPLEQTQWTQPLLFAVEYSLACQWLSWGVKPEAMLGHSLGEYVAACLAEVFSLEDALTLVAKRAQWMQQMPPGAMLAVVGSEAEVTPWLQSGITLAAANGAVCTLAGSVAAIATLQSQITEAGIKATLLQTSHAFHSEAMQGMVPQFRALLQSLSLQPPQLAYLSNVTGTWIQDQEATSPDYWVQHLLQTVRFGDALDELLADPNWVLLEVGPQRTLTGLARRHPCYQGQGLVNSLGATDHQGQDLSESLALWQSLGQLWLQGVQPKWKPFYAPESTHRIPLPTYPFERQRHWLAPPTSGAFNSLQGLARNPDPNQWFYVPTWKQLPPLLLTPTLEPQTWLIFRDSLGLGLALAKQLRQQNQRVVLVGYGKQRRFSRSNYFLDPSDPTAFQQLWLKLQSHDLQPQHIVHLWNIQRSNKGSATPQAVADHQERGLYTLLNLVQGLGKLGYREPLQLTVIANGGYNVFHDEAINPLHSLTLGAVKVIPQEYRNITCRYLDLENMPAQELSDPEQIQAILQEILAPAAPLEVAHRGQSRWQPHYEAVNLPEPTSAPLTPGAVYLITGGFGGIGWAIAEYLAQQLQAKLVLVSRSALPPIAEWEEWCQSTTADDPTQQKIQQVRRLQELGAKVWVGVADVADLKAMQRLVKQAESAFGEITGLFHCAGIADFGGIIQGRNRETTEKILASKVAGTLVLQEIFQDRTLDIWLASSSLSTAIYKTLFGQVGYSVANEFLSAFSEYQRSQGQQSALAVHWTEWEDVGMAVNSRIERNQNKARVEEEQQWLVPLYPSEGQAALARMIGSPHARVMVTPQNLSNLVTLVEQWDVDQALTSMVEEDATQPKQSRAGLRTPYVPARHQLDELLIPLWEQAIGIAPLGLSDNLYEMGGDSLLAISLLYRMEQVLSIPLPMSILLEHPTLASLTAYLQTQHQESVSQWLTPLAAVATSDLNEPPVQATFPDSCPEPMLANFNVDLLPQPLVIKLQAGTAKCSPLFMIHPIGGGIDSYVTLSRYLNSDWPIYGVRALGLDVDTTPLHNIQQMASCYLRSIRQIQEQGPYYLGGWSMGGVVAYEMAQQLINQGETVGGLIMVDSPAPGLEFPHAEIDTDVFLRGLGFSAAQCQAWQETGCTGSDWLTALLTMGKIAKVLPTTLSIETMQRLYDTFAAHHTALSTYLAQEIQPCPGQFPTQFFAAEIHDVKRFTLLPTWGQCKIVTKWQAYLPLHLTHYTLPCDHYGLLQEPPVVNLAAELNQWLLKLCIPRPISVGVKQ